MTSQEIMDTVLTCVINIFLSFSYITLVKKKRIGKKSLTGIVLAVKSTCEIISIISLIVMVYNELTRFIAMVSVSI